MKITVIGATGMVGSRVVTEAVARGHVVTAASRRAGRLSDGDSVTTATVDATEPDILKAVLTDADAAVLAVRPAACDEHMLAPLTAAFLDAAVAARTSVLVVGGAGPLLSPNGFDLLAVDDPVYVPAAWRSLAAASTQQLQTCQKHPGDGWTYLSPPAILEPGTRTGYYRCGTTSLLTDAAGRSAISVEDLAVAVVDEIERPGNERHFTIAQAQLS